MNFWLEALLWPPKNIFLALSLLTNECIGCTMTLSMGAWCVLLVDIWWRNQMETFSALLAICEGNPPVTSQRPVTRGFGIFFDLCPKKGWASNRDTSDLRRHCAHYDVTEMSASWQLTVHLVGWQWVLITNSTFCWLTVRLDNWECVVIFERSDDHLTYSYITGILVLGRRLIA